MRSRNSKRQHPRRRRQRRSVSTHKLFKTHYKPNFLSWSMKRVPSLAFGVRSAGACHPIDGDKSTAGAA